MYFSCSGLLHNWGSRVQSASQDRHNSFRHHLFGRTRYKKTSAQALHPTGKICSENQPDTPKAYTQSCKLYTIPRTSKPDFQTGPKPLGVNPRTLRECTLVAPETPQTIRVMTIEFKGFGVSETQNPKP